MLKTWDLQKKPVQFALFEEHSNISCLKLIEMVILVVFTSSLLASTWVELFGVTIQKFRGRPVDSEGRGSWHFLEMNILTLKMLQINYLSCFGKKINNLTLNLPRIWGKCQFFQTFSAHFARNSKILIIFRARFAPIKFLNNDVLLSYFKYLYIQCINGYILCTISLAPPTPINHKLCEVNY